MLGGAAGESPDEPTGRDLRTMFRTAMVMVGGIAFVVGGIVAHFVHEDRQDARAEALEARLAARITAVEKWQTEKDRDVQREMWRRQMLQLQPAAPATKGQP